MPEYTRIARCLSGTLLKKPPDVISYRVGMTRGLGIFVLLSPIGDEYVELPGLLGVPCRREHESLPITIALHWETSTNLDNRTPNKENRSVGGRVLITFDFLRDKWR